MKLADDMTVEDGRRELQHRLGWLEGNIAFSGGISEMIREARAIRLVLDLTVEEALYVSRETERVVAKLARRKERARSAAPSPVVHATSDAELLRASVGVLCDMVIAGDRARSVLARIQKERGS